MLRRPARAMATDGDSRLSRSYDHKSHHHISHHRLRRNRRRAGRAPAYLLRCLLYNRCDRYCLRAEDGEQGDSARVSHCDTHVRFSRSFGDLKQWLLTQSAPTGRLHLHLNTGARNHHQNNGYLFRWILCALFVRCGNAIEQTRKVERRRVWRSAAIAARCSGSLPVRRNSPSSMCDRRPPEGALG